MKTITEQIAEDIGNLKQLAEDFFINHSHISFCERDCEDRMLLPGRSDYRWDELDKIGQKLQARLYKEYSYVVELMGVLISELPPESKKTFDKYKKEILEYIEHSCPVWTSSVLETVDGHLDRQYELLQNLYSQNDGGYIFVPDTNAILINPYLDKWTFDEATNFEILLTPSVFSELDQLKVISRNDDVRKKAQSIIRTIKEYRRRGRITDGVTLKKDVSTIRTLAVEPAFENTFSWLKRDNKDDRLLASFIEIIKEHTNSVVVLVTADINLQNKAEYARLPFVEPCAGN